MTNNHVGMYLQFSKSPYTEDQLTNYKSLDWYQNSANRSLREIFSQKFGENVDGLNGDGKIQELQL